MDMIYWDENRWRPGAIPPFSDHARKTATEDYPFNLNLLKQKKLKTIVFTNNAFRPLAVMAVDWETLTPRGKSVNPWAQVIEKNVMALSREMARESQSAFDTYREILDHLFNCLQNGYHRLYR